MSEGEETTTPVTSGETVPVTTGATTTPTKEETEETEPFLVPFGGAIAKVTMQMKGLTWGWFCPVTQETWSLTLGSQLESRYDASVGLSYIPEDAGVGVSHESVDTELFVETWLGLFRRGQDHLAQMIEALFEGLPQLVAEAVQREMRVRLLVPLIVQPQVPPLAPQLVPLPPQWVPGGRPLDRAPREPHCPTELLDATFDSTAEKLMFFM
ncbi:UNVERIFIED_CONTAM: hypothetical protein K2H54_053127 [Gekko kuhli]